MAERKPEPRSFEEMQEDVARLVADWPDPEIEPGAAIREALTGTAPRIRR